MGVNEYFYTSTNVVCVVGGGGTYAVHKATVVLSASVAFSIISCNNHKLISYPHYSIRLP